MITRIWHGYTVFENANSYETLLLEEVFEGIHNRHIEGVKSIQLLRRTFADETEFITIMMFESLEAVREFAGENYEAAVVPEKARELLKRFDEISQHYEVIA
ncbi:MAG: antibiotic biosynthesis monooxygenase [Panacibacter sp.]